VTDVVAYSPADEVRISYNPMPAAERVAHYSSLVTSRIMWLALAAIICCAVILARRDQMAADPRLKFVLFGAGLGYSVIWLIMALVGLFRARRVLNSIGQGVAVRIARWGVDLHGVPLPWSDVKTVAARRHRFSAYGPDLVVVTTGGEKKTLPWLYLDTLPGSVDAAVQAYTAGAQRLDVSRLDH